MGYFNSTLIRVNAMVYSGVLLNVMFYSGVLSV